MREAMPTVSAWVDELREAFGADGINQSIRNGMAGGADFFADENGHTIGCEVMPGQHAVGLADIVLAKPGEDDGRSR